MSDSHLRELERRWKETGSVEDEAAWLNQRVRFGRLESHRLELAGYLGYPAARLALGANAPSPPAGVKGLLLHLKTKWGAIALVRAVVACAQEAAPDLPDWPAEVTTTYQRAVDRLDMWCRCPCTAHGNLAADSIGWMSHLFVGGSPEPAWARSLALAVLRACSVAEGDDFLGFTCVESLEAVADTLGAKRLMTAITRALTSWGLTAGTLEEHAKLALRLEQGLIEKSALSLAARLGNEASALVLGSAAPQPALCFDEDNQVGRDEARKVLRAIAKHGAEAAVRMGIAMLSGSADTAPERNEHEEAVLTSARVWALCPCEAHAERAESTARALRGRVEQLPPEPSPAEPNPAEPVRSYREARNEEERAAAREALVAHFEEASAREAPSRRRWEAERFSVLGELPGQPGRLPNLLPDLPSWMRESAEISWYEWRLWTASLQLWLLRHGDPLRDR